METTKIIELHTLTKTYLILFINGIQKSTIISLLNKSIDFVLTLQASSISLIRWIELDNCKFIWKISVESVDLTPCSVSFWAIDISLAHKIKFHMPNLIFERLKWCLFYFWGWIKEWRKWLKPFASLRYFFFQRNRRLYLKIGSK